MRRFDIAADGTTAGIREAHLARLAEELGVSRPGQIIERIDAAVASWPTFAAECDVPSVDVRRIQAHLEARRREVFSLLRISD